ncbi:MAG: type IV pilus biogenesis protein PilM [Acutalibacteraceae bacterium]
MAKVNSAVGIEYNSHEIRAVELTKNADGSISVAAFGKERVKENVITDGVISDPNLFSDAVGNLFTLNKIKANIPIVIGVNNENVIMRYATLPKVPEEKLRDAILMQAQDFIPVPVNELTLDFINIDETVDDDDQPALNIMLVGARNTMIQNLLQSFDDSKMTVVDIDSSFLAWVRKAINDAGDDEAFGFFSLTDDVLNFVAIDNKNIKMVRSINIPDRATADVKSIFNNSSEMAENEVDNVADLLYSELSSSINYFQMQTGIVLSKVYFKVLSRREEQLCEMLNQKSYIPLEIPKYYQEFATDEFRPANYTGCIELAKIALEG